MEPNGDYIFSIFRKWWYKINKEMFTSEFEADLDGIFFKKYFYNYNFLRIKKIGGPAYILLFNSLIFRLPKILKKILAFFLLPLEYIYNLMPGYFCAVIMAEMKKKKLINNNQNC